VLGADHPTTLGLRLDLAAVQSRVGLHAEALAAYEDLLRLVGDRHSRARDLRGRIAAERRHQEDALQARIAELVAASGDHLIAELEAALDQARAIQTPKNAYRLQVPLLRAMLATGKYAPQSPPGADLLRELCRLHDRYGAAGPEVDRDLTLADRLVGH